MKIGLITFHNSNNYGAVLQTLGVQKTIEKLGHEPEILDYICYKKRNWYKSFRISKSPKANITNLINFPYLTVKNKKFKKYVETNYNLTENTYYSSIDMKDLNHEFDAFVTGSDQVWNPFNTGFDKAYLLDFVEDNDKKISYAASFGVANIPEEFHAEYKRLLSQINNLSVREESGKELVEAIAGKESKVVLDPTLLITKSEWQQFSKRHNKVKEKYLLLYTVNNSKSCCKYAESLAKLMGLKVVRICSDGRDYFNHYQTVIPSPEEYVGLFENAEFVVTNSFHGVAFSINLNKQFYVFLGKGINSHTRMLNLLNICKLRDRIINEDSNIEVKSAIDYNTVNKILERNREESLKFLENAFKQINDKNTL